MWLLIMLQQKLRQLIHIMNAVILKLVLEQWLA